MDIFHKAEYIGESIASHCWLNIWVHKFVFVLCYWNILLHIGIELDKPSNGFNNLSIHSDVGAPIEGDPTLDWDSVVNYFTYVCLKSVSALIIMAHHDNCRGNIHFVIAISSCYFMEKCFINTCLTGVVNWVF